MIKLFRTLNPLNILWLIILLFGLRVGYIINGTVKTGFAFSELFSRLLIAPGPYIIPPLYNITVASIIVLVQALLLNHLVNHFNLLGKPSFLPALMYVTLTALFTPFLVLSPQLVCNFLVIWMLYKLFSFYKSKDAKSTTYDLGLMVAIGSIIYLPFNYFFLAIWVALIIFRPFNWRELATAVMGYATIFFFLAVYYYLNGYLGRFYSIWLPLGTKFPDTININYYNYLVLIPVIVILLLCLVKLQQNFFRSYVQVRKSFQLLLIIFFIAGLSFYTKAAFQLGHFVLCAVTAAIFFSYYFLYARVRWLYEILFGLLLVSIVYFQFNTF